MGGAKQKRNGKKKDEQATSHILKHGQRGDLAPPTKQGPMHATPETPRLGVIPNGTLLSCTLGHSISIWVWKLAQQF